MNKHYLTLFPKVLGVYYFNEHQKYEKKWVDKCYSIQKEIEPGGKNWLSQTVYNTENTYNLNEDKEFKPLTDWLADCAKDYANTLHYSGDLTHTNSFFNIYKKYDYQEWHDHTGTTLSGIYCLSGKDGSADIHFTDFYFQRYSIKVNKYIPENSALWTEKFEPGKFLLFKSDLHHSVNRHNLSTNRLSIATNFIVK